jgi:hypothetical protein
MLSGGMLLATEDTCQVRAVLRWCCRQVAQTVQRLSGRLLLSGV